MGFLWGAVILGSGREAAAPAASQPRACPQTAGGGGEGGRAGEQAPLAKSVLCCLITQGVIVYPNQCLELYL